MPLMINRMMVAKNYIARQHKILIKERPIFANFGSNTLDGSTRTLTRAHTHTRACLGVKDPMERILKSTLALVKLLHYAT